jgi:hypothetical protein
MHACDSCGLLHEEVATVPTGQTAEPESSGEVAKVSEEAAEAAVEVARIEGDTAVKIAKIEARVADDELELRLAALEGELRGMREAMTPPEPAVPEPVVVAQDVAPEPEPEMPPRDERSEPKASHKSKGMFGF